MLSQQPRSLVDHPGSTNDRMPEIHPAHRQRPTPTSSLVHFAVLGSIALLPYLLLRGRFTLLQQKLRDVEMEHAAVRRELKALASGASTRRKDHEQLVALLEETKGSMEGLKAYDKKNEKARAEAGARIHVELHEVRQALKKMEASALQHNCAREEWERMHHNGLKALLQEYQQSRAYLSNVKELGLPLADVAAFIHEIELRQGYTSQKNDGRGIERIRHLARRLQELPPLPHPVELKQERDPDVKSPTRKESRNA